MDFILRILSPYYHTMITEEGHEGPFLEHFETDRYLITSEDFSGFTKALWLNRSDIDEMHHISILDLEELLIKFNIRYGFADDEVTSETILFL